MWRSLVWLAVTGVALACATPEVPVDGAFGANPPLPPPRTSVVPTVNIAPARGWSEGEKPVAAQGLAVERFAAGLDHPRWLHVLPNGDVLVAETNAPAGRRTTGVRNWLMKRVMKRTGAAVPSANRITLLRHPDGDGRGEQQSQFASGLNAPLGLALRGDG